jgi:DNA-directed RNA polymerase specialized sigma24 family protein
VLTIVRHAAYHWLRKIGRPRWSWSTISGAERAGRRRPTAPNAEAALAQADTARLEQAIAALPVPFARPWCCAA